MEARVEREKIKEQTISLLATKLDIDSAGISEETNIYLDLGINSLKAMELIGDVEDRFNFEIPDTELMNFRNVGDIIDYLEETL